MEREQEEDKKGISSFLSQGQDTKLLTDFNDSTNTGISIKIIERVCTVVVFTFTGELYTVSQLWVSGKRILSWSGRRLRREEEEGDSTVHGRRSNTQRTSWDYNVL